MALLRQNLINHILSDAGVSALVGSRVRPITMPQSDDYPFIGVGQTGCTRSYLMNGTQKTLVRTKFDVQCEGRSYQSAALVAEAVRNAVSGAKGMLGITDEESDVKHIAVEDDKDLSAIHLGEGDNWVYPILLQLVVMSEEPAPTLGA